jgi:hypothetical protein
MRQTWKEITIKFIIFIAAALLLLWVSGCKPREQRVRDKYVLKVYEQSGSLDEWSIIIGIDSVYMHSSTTADIWIDGRKSRIIGDKLLVGR